MSELRRSFQDFLAEGKAPAASVDVVVTEPLSETESMPLVVRATVADVDLADWAGDRTDEIRERLVEHGAILFRGFAVDALPAFRRFVALFDDRLLGYEEQHTPRTHVEEGVYTSTEYPPAHHVPMHSENSKNRAWPRKIWFYCERPADEGGETPIADNRVVYRALGEGLRERFERRGVMYVRNFGEGVGVPWQQAFQTEDPEEVERFSRAEGMELEWKPDGGLRTRAVAHATAVHPDTGETLWFNQAHLFHSSSLRADVRDSLLSTLAPEDLPSNALHGDGTPIADGDVAEIAAAFAAASVAPEWRRGDVLMVDNMLVSHGRRPYAGERRVLVAMAERHEAGARA